MDGGLGAGGTGPAADAGPGAHTGAEQPAHPRTKAAQREATTSALIATAREMFAERGYAGVATEDVVRQAGVTRGALYHHFKAGKEELFRAVLVQVSAEIAKRVAARAREQKDPWDALVVGIDEFLDACATRDVQRIVLLDGPAVLGWDLWRAIDQDYGLGLVEAAVQRALDAGRLIPQPARALAHVILGAVHEAAMVVAEAEDPAAARTEMGATVRRLLDGLKSPA